MLKIENKSHGKLRLEKRTRAKEKKFDFEERESEEWEQLRVERKREWIWFWKRKIERNRNVSREKEWWIEKEKKKMIWNIMPRWNLINLEYLYFGNKFKNTLFWSIRF